MRMDQCQRLRTNFKFLHTHSLLMPSNCLNPISSQKHESKLVLYLLWEATNSSQLWRMSYKILGSMIT